MKKITAIFCTLLIGVSTVFSGCVSNDDSSIPDAMNNDGEPTCFKATETTLIENKNSDYKIVIPEEATKMEKYAAQELQYFLYESTGCELPIISDVGLLHNNTQKYLSVGDTSLLKAQTDIKIDYVSMGETGPSIDTVGNTVYMAGAAAYGTLYSVYKFLQYQIGYKTYAYDCVKYDYHSTLPLLDFDYHYVPNVEWLVAHDHEVYGLDNIETAARMYLYGYNNDGGQELFEGQIFSGLWCHSIPSVMPEASYPDAYNNGQLCMSDPDVLQTFCENFTLGYALSASGPFIMLGGNDNEGVCNCDGCKEIIAKYGSGGLMLKFINKVAEYVENYFIEKGIDKKLVIVGLYYWGYTEVPVIQNADGTYSPIDETAIPDNKGNITAGACYAPIEACFTHPMGDEGCEANLEYTENLKKWKALTDELLVYTYGSNWSGGYAHSLWFNNWSALAGNFKYFEDLGVRYVFDEANRHGISPFSSMRVFIRSQYAWDGDYDFETLVNEFTDAYYGIVAEDMREYFYEVMEHFQAIYKKMNDYHHDCYLSTTQYWPHETVLNFATILENAMHTIEMSDLSESNKAVYMERVKREWYIVKLDEYNMYKDYLDGDSLEELKKIVEEGKEKYTIVGQ